LIIGVSALTVVSLGLGGLLASGILDEEKRPVVERIVESGPVPVPQAPPPAAPKREPAPPAAAKKPAEPAAQPAPAAEPLAAAPAAAAPPAAAPAAAEPPVEKPAKTEPRTRHPRTVAAASAAEATPTVRLAVVSDPPGAEVIARWDGGEKKGKAPFQFDAPKGAHVKLDFTLKGYSPSQEEVVADAPHTVSSELVQFLGD
jgi:hypothetical protein